MPFTTSAFFEVFARYNDAIWPMPVAAYALAVLILAMLPCPGRRWSAIVVTFGLAVMWLVNGVGYHWVFFSQINPVARVFAVLFVVEALALAYAGMAFAGLRFAVRRDLRSSAAFVMIVYAMAIYPLWGAMAGHSYPSAPMFGVAPCPTTIFTIGVLLTANWRAARRLLAVPIVWSAIGGSAALLLGVPQDYGLVAAGMMALYFVILDRKRWRSIGLASNPD